MKRRRERVDRHVDDRHIEDRHDRPEDDHGGHREQRSVYAGLVRHPFSKLADALEAGVFGGSGAAGATQIPHTPAYALGSG